MLRSLTFVGVFELLFWQAFCHSASFFKAQPKVLRSFLFFFLPNFSYFEMSHLLGVTYVLLTRLKCYPCRDTLRLSQVSVDATILI